MCLFIDKLICWGVVFAVGIFWVVGVQQSVPAGVGHSVLGRRLRRLFHFAGLELLRSF